MPGEEERKREGRAGLTVESPACLICIEPSLAAAGSPACWAACLLGCLPACFAIMHACTCTMPRVLLPAGQG